MHDDNDEKDLDQEGAMAAGELDATKLVLKFSGWAVGVIGIGMIGWMSYITSQIHAMPGVVRQYIEIHENRPHRGAVERHEIVSLENQMSSRLTRIEQKLDSLVTQR